MSASEFRTACCNTTVNEVFGTNADKTYTALLEVGLVDLTKFENSESFTVTIFFLSLSLSLSLYFKQPTPT